MTEANTGKTLNLGKSALPPRRKGVSAVAGFPDVMRFSFMYAVHTFNVHRRVLVRYFK